MRFSNGKQSEKHLVLDEAGTVRLDDLRMPVGAMLNCTDEPGEALGPARPTRNDFYAELLGTERLRYLPNSKRPNRGPKITKAGDRAAIGRGPPESPARRRRDLFVRPRCPAAGATWPTFSWLV